MGLINSVKKRVKLLKTFGFETAVSGLLASNVRWPAAVSRLALRWHDRVIINYLKANFSYVFNKNYENENIKPLNPAPVWVMWLQGYDAMPEIVKACYASIKASCANHTVILITHENLRNYINLPEHIFNLLNANKMTRNAFANLCRLYLLYAYGGLWLDATIFVTREIPEEIFAMPFYTINYDFNLNHRNVCLGRWTTFLLGAQPGNILCRTVLDLLTEYWRRNDTLIDYVLFDYCIAAAYSTLPECRKLIDAVPRSNLNWRTLQDLLNSEFNQDKFNELTLNTQFFKLTYKQNFNKLINNRKTFYGHILELYK